MRQTKEHKPFHFVAEAFVAARGKVLLVRHHRLNIWLPPGGHKETKDGFYIESPEECARREVKEETGLNVEIIGPAYPKRSGRHAPLYVPVAMHIHAFDDTHDHLGFDFFAKPKGKQTKPKKTDEEFAWFDQKELAAAKRTGIIDGTRIPPAVLSTAIMAIRTVR